MFSPDPCAPRFPTYREVKLLSSLSSLVYYDWVGDGVNHWDTYRSPPSAAFRSVAARYFTRNVGCAGA